jgi:hypothetical protein
LTLIRGGDTVSTNPTDRTSREEEVFHSEMSE